MILAPDGQLWGTPAQLATTLGVTVAMIRNWRRRDGLPVVGGLSPLVRAAEIERDKRQSGRGRRRLAAAGVRGA